MALFQDSGQTPERRREEADFILGVLEDHLVEMTEWEQDFVEHMQGRTPISPKQLFKLRDLKEAYGE